MVAKSPQRVGAIAGDAQLKMVECRGSDVKRTSPRSKITIKYGNVGKSEKLKAAASRPAEEMRRFSPRIRLKEIVEMELSERKKVEDLAGEEETGGARCKESKTLSNKRKRAGKNAGAEKVVEVNRVVKRVDDGNGFVEETNEDEKKLLASKRAEKEALVRKRVELLEGQEEGGGGGEFQELSSVSCVRKPPKQSRFVKEGRKSNVNTSVANIIGGGISVTGGGEGVGSIEKSDTLKVKETLRLFNKHFLHFVQEEETRCAKLQADRRALKNGSKSKKGVPVDCPKNSAKRPDLKAISKMMENGQVLFPDKRIGDIPGIKVGHQFYSRAEMVAVGFHSHWLNGIDYMGQAYKKTICNYTFPIAVAIVLSGQYEDDLDNAEDVVYTGQGGHNLTGDKRQIKDQVLERGNLAMKNCVDQDVPVRVIRGHESKRSYCGKVYTYDGLYKVADYWAEKGISGFTVFKFRLKRLDRQPVLTTNQVFFTYGRVPETISEIRGLVCEDITGGLEDKPIPATNQVDDPPIAPAGFKYCKSIHVSKSVVLPPNAPGCNCKGSCIDPRTCACAIRNGSDFPYVSLHGGRLIEAKDIVFECGPQCGCGPDCVNRTSQKGIRYRLEVFRTAKKGWAVRSWDFIPSGAPVCEYVGNLMRAEDLDNANASGNYYIFDIDCLQTMRGLGGRERRSRDGPPSVNVLERPDDQKIESLSEFSIDAGSSGNVARFINHSCEPNLFVQCVLSSHNDPKLARVMLFAADNIPPLQELTYDYGYPLDSVVGQDGKIIKMNCYCGAPGCRKRLF